MQNIPYPHDDGCRTPHVGSLEKVADLIMAIHDLSPDAELPEADLLLLVEEILELLYFRSKDPETSKASIPIGQEPISLDNEVANVLGNSATLKVGKRHHILDLSRYEGFFEDLLYRVHLILRDNGLGIFPIGDTEEDRKMLIPEPVRLAGRSPDIVYACMKTRRKLQGCNPLRPADYLRMVAQTLVDSEEKGIRPAYGEPSSSHTLSRRISSGKNRGTFRASGYHAPGVRHFRNMRDLLAKKYPKKVLMPHDRRDRVTKNKDGGTLPESNQQTRTRRGPRRRHGPGGSRESRRIGD